MKNLKVSLLQWDLAWENPLENLKMAERLLKKLVNTDLVVLPEMFTTGFSMNTKSLAEEMGGNTVSWMLLQAKKLQTAISGSLIIRENDKNFNRLIVAFPNGQLEYYDKRHLFTYAGEHKVFSAGKQALVITVKGWRIKMLICYDLRFPVWSRNADDTDFLIYVANWPESRSYAWNQLLKARAIENLSYVAGVNRIGKDGNSISYRGDSQLVDFSGQVLGTLEDKEGILNVILDFSDLSAFRERFPFLEDRDNFNIEI